MSFQYPLLLHENYQVLNGTKASIADNHATFLKGTSFNLAPSRSFSLKERAEKVLKQMKEGLKVAPRDLVLKVVGPHKLDGPMESVAEAVHTLGG